MTHFLAREMTNELLDLHSKFKVIAITGPRQSGKTTLAKTTFKERPYVNLEEIDIRSLAKDDPRQFLAQYPEGVIIDEIQHVPSLLSYIQVIVDKEDKAGMFILTGSQQFSLQQAISQSLAGRVALLELLPLTLAEVRGYRNMSIDEYLLTGSYPDIYQRDLNPTKVYANYVRTYLERDVKQIINVKDLNIFRKFIKLCAGRIGQILNVTSLANDVGMSVNTIKHWLSVLEMSYIIFQLQPYYENFGKRLIKAPKLYFNDVGLAAYLLGIETTIQMSRDPLRGALFENLVLLDLIKTKFNKGQEARFYFYRDSNQHEIDIIYQVGHELVPIEIKSGQTYNRDFFKNLEYFRSIVGERCRQGIVIYSGQQEQIVGENKIINYQNSSDILAI